jgi:hypothetical protein
MTAGADLQVEVNSSFRAHAAAMSDCPFMAALTSKSCM